MATLPPVAPSQSPTFAPQMATLPPVAPPAMPQFQAHPIMMPQFPASPIVLPSPPAIIPAPPSTSTPYRPLKENEWQSINFIAIISMILSISSFFAASSSLDLLGQLFALGGLIMGLMGIFYASQHGGEGKMMSKASIIMTGVFLIFILLILPAVQEEVANNLQNIFDTEETTNFWDNYEKINLGD